MRRWVFWLLLCLAPIMLSEKTATGASNGAESVPEAWTLSRQMHLTPLGFTCRPVNEDRVHIVFTFRGPADGGKTHVLEVTGYHEFSFFSWIDNDRIDELVFDGERVYRRPAGDEKRVYWPDETGGFAAMDNAIGEEHQSYSYNHILLAEALIGCCADPIANEGEIENLPVDCRTRMKRLLERGRTGAGKPRAAGADVDPPEAENGGGNTPIATGPESAREARNTKLNWIPLERALSGRDRPILLLLTADEGCPPCTAFDRTLEAFASTLNERFALARVDAYARPDVLETYQTTSIPCTYFLRPDGTVIGDPPGYMDADRFRQLTGKVFDALGK